ncbi:MAG TPA: TlpA disulfide reductase family protein [Caldilineaceae bacterium]|nr:TlpA disulfide reductase family protein [Caldilineaceae bacterium]
MSTVSQATTGGQGEKPGVRRRLLPVILVLALAWIGVFYLQRQEHGTGLVGQPAPPLAISTFDGEPLALTDLRGQGVVVNFWASWCEPCRVEMPLLAEAAQANRGQIAFVGVNVLDSEPAARAFLAEFGVTYPNGPDTDDRWARRFGADGVPATFFIDSEGVVRSVVLGPVAGAAELERHLARIRPR